MPLLDVSDVLDDPDFADSFVCARQVQSVGTDGLAVNTPTSIPFNGVPTSDKGDQLLRQAEGSNIAGTIMIHTHFVLRAGRDGYDADVVTWAGRKFTVTDVYDYSRFGAGFVSARAELIPLSGGTNA